MTKEFVEGNYFEALLRAAILLGDLRRATPVREITISGYMMQDHVRILRPRCRIVAQTDQLLCAEMEEKPSFCGESCVILYPIRKKIHS